MLMVHEKFSKIYLIRPAEIVHYHYYGALSARVKKNKVFDYVFYYVLPSYVFANCQWG